MEMAGSLLMLSGLAEFLETVFMNLRVFWNITSCRLVKYCCAPNYKPIVNTGLNPCK